MIRSINQPVLPALIKLAIDALIDATDASVGMGEADTEQKPLMEIF